MPRLCQALGWFSCWHDQFRHGSYLPRASGGESERPMSNDFPELFYLVLVVRTGCAELLLHAN